MTELDHADSILSPAFTSNDDMLSSDSDLSDAESDLDSTYGPLTTEDNAENENENEEEDDDDGASTHCSSTGYTGDSEQSLASVETFDQPTKRRRLARRRRGTETWIERLYSNTPYYDTPEEDSDTRYPTVTPTLPKTIKILPDRCASSESLTEQQVDLTIPAPPPDIFSHRAVTILDPCQVSSKKDSLRRSPSGMAGSLMDSLNFQTLDDDVLAWGLVTIVNNLLTDSYKVQATYRSYSFNHPTPESSHGEASVATSFPQSKE
ncbi:MAG: hypothetical protein SGILL_001290 [Bacillariaceae sp.]